MLNRIPDRINSLLNLTRRLVFLNEHGRSLPTMLLFLRRHADVLGNGFELIRRKLEDTTHTATSLKNGFVEIILS